MDEIDSSHRVYDDRPLEPLYAHEPHPHESLHAADVHMAHLTSAGLNTRLAVWLTKAVSNMWTAWAFVALALVGLLGLLGWLNPFTFLLATWFSQQFLQLVALPVLGVGQSVLSQHAEAQSDEQYKATLNTYHDTEQIAAHLAAQDGELLALKSEIGQLRGAVDSLLVSVRAIEARMPAKRSGGSGKGQG